MSELTDKLRTAASGYKGSEMGGLLQWAALHISSQNEALAEVRQELADEAHERLRLENALHAAKLAVEAALASITAPMCPPIELARDMAPHINLMAGHGDPDYLTGSGRSIRHVDCRTTKTRTAKAKTA